LKRRAAFILQFLLIVLAACRIAHSQSYEVYVRNHPYQITILTVGKQVYCPAPALAKALELQLNQKEETQWIGEKPLNPQKGFWIDGKPFSAILTKDDGTYVELHAFLPKVGYRLVVNPQTRILDIVRQRKRTGEILILKYLTEPVSQHLEKNTDLNGYVSKIKTWNLAFDHYLNDPDTSFETAENAVYNIRFFSDLYTAVARISEGFQSESERIEKLLAGFPTDDPPKQFAESHKALLEVKQLCKADEEAYTRASVIATGLRVSTEVKPDEYISRIQGGPLIPEILRLLALDDALDNAYKKYIKTFHTELSAVLLETHYTAQEAKTELDLPKALGRVQYARDLDFKFAVPGQKMTPDEEAKRFQKAMSEIKPESIEKDDAILKDFGFLPKSFDTKTVDFEEEAKMVPAFYDPEIKQFFYRTDIPEDWLLVVAYHELTHALTDQYFGLKRLTDSPEAENNSDLGLAARALIEGDAEYAMIIPTAEDLNLDANFLRSIFIRYQTGNSFSPSEGPMIYKEDTFFPYAEGMLFVKQLKAWGGWDLVNKAYLNPPKSTHEILHPEDYALVREAPVDFIFPDHPGTKLVANDVMGEFNTLVLYATYHSGSILDLSGWRGDRFQIFKNGDRDAIVWISAWSGNDSAAAFVKTYQELLGRIKAYGDAPVQTGTKYSEDKMKSDFEYKMSHTDEVLKEGLTLHRESPYTNVVLQKDNLVTVLQNIPNGEVDAWKNYADQIKPTQKTLRPPSANLWPYQDMPQKSTAVIPPSAKPIADALLDIKPDSWSIKGTELADFPLMVESPQGARFFVGHTNSNNVLSDSTTQTAISLFARHCYPGVNFTARDTYFGESGLRFHGAEGEGRDRNGKPILVAFWVSPAGAKAPFVMIAEADPHIWIKSKKTFSSFMDTLADWISRH